MTARLPIALALAPRDQGFAEPSLRGPVIAGNADLVAAAVRLLSTG